VTVCNGSLVLYPDPWGVTLACNDPWAGMMVLTLTLPVMVWHVVAPPAPQTSRSILMSGKKASLFTNKFVFFGGPGG
jgi:hypothetical protein